MPYPLEHTNHWFLKEDLNAEENPRLLLDRTPLVMLDSRGASMADAEAASKFQLEIEIHEVALLLGPFFNAECVLVADLASMWRHHQQRRESELGLFFEQKIQSLRRSFSNLPPVPDIEIAEMSETPEVANGHLQRYASDISTTGSNHPRQSLLGGDRPQTSSHPPQNHQMEDRRSLLKQRRGLLKEIQKLRTQRDQEYATDRRIVQNMVELWKALKRLRRKQGFSCCDLVAQFSVKDGSAEEDEERMHEEVEASLSETLELHRVGSMIQVLEYEQAQRERDATFRSAGRVHKKSNMGSPPEFQPLEEAEVRRELELDWIDAHGEPGEAVIYPVILHRPSTHADAVSEEEVRRREKLFGQRFSVQLSTGDAVIARTEAYDLDVDLVCKMGEVITVQFARIPDFLVLTVMQEGRKGKRRSEVASIEIPLDERTTCRDNRELVLDFRSRSEFETQEDVQEASLAGNLVIEESDGLYGCRLVDYPPYRRAGKAYLDLRWVPVSSSNTTHSTAAGANPFSSARMQFRKGTNPLRALLSADDLRELIDGSELDPNDPANSYLYDLLEGLDPEELINTGFTLTSIGKEDLSFLPDWRPLSQRQTLALLQRDRDTDYSGPLPIEEFDVTYQMIRPTFRRQKHDAELQGFSAQIKDIRRSKLSQQTRRRVDHQTAEFVIEPRFPNVDRLWRRVKEFFLPRRPLKPTREEREEADVVPSWGRLIIQINRGYHVPVRRYIGGPENEQESRGFPGESSRTASVHSGFSSRASRGFRGGSLSSQSWRGGRFASSGDGHPGGESGRGRGARGRGLRGSRGSGMWNSRRHESVPRSSLLAGSGGGFQQSGISRLLAGGPASSEVTGLGGERVGGTEGYGYGPEPGEEHWDGEEDEEEYWEENRVEEEEEEFDNEMDLRLLNSVVPVVEVRFRDSWARTVAQRGPDPVFNENLTIEYEITPDHEGNPDPQRIHQDVEIHLFDELTLENPLDTRLQDTHESRRHELRWLGKILIPFPQIFLNNKVEGTFVVDVPKVNLGYQHPPSHDADTPQRDFSGWGRSSTTATSSESSSSEERTRLSLFVTLDPLLPKPCSEGDMVESSLDESLHRMVRNWEERIRGLKQCQNRRIMALVGNVKGEAELLSRFVTPQSPPSGLDSLPMVLRFVSLIPFVEDYLSFFDRFNVWCTSTEFLDLLAGDSEEHAILLCNYLLALGKDAFVVIGSASPEGDTTWVMIRDGRKCLLLNPCSGQQFSSTDPQCPLRSIGTIFNDKNIWANIQPHEQPYLLNFSLTDVKCWTPLFDGVRRIMPSDLVSVQEPLTYVPIPSVAVLEAEHMIREMVTDHIIRLRADIRSTSWHNSPIFRDLLELFEQDRQGIPLDFALHEDRLDPLRRNNYSLEGFPLNFSLNMRLIRNSEGWHETILDTLTRTQLHQNAARDVKFAVGVRIFPYVNDVASLWIYYVALTSTRKVTVRDQSLGRRYLGSSTRGAP